MPKSNYEHSWIKPEHGNILNCLSLCLQSIYKKNDIDNSGTMSTPEMRVAFKDAGW